MRTAILVALFVVALETSTRGQSLPAPPAGRYFHGCYPGGVTGEEDDITAQDLKAYEDAVKTKAAWVYFSHNWYRDRRFPEQTAQWIRAQGATPYIRLMLRSEDHALGKPENHFGLQAIIDGKFDNDLIAWGEAAARFKTPLIVEYGTEVNGDWFGWNGRFHGGGRPDGFGAADAPDGPERFVAAYRHIVDVMRAAGAANITWVFHLDVSTSPATEWNRFENYYPGSDYADWIGVSCYGPQSPADGPEECVPFRSKFDPIYPRIVKLAPDKPIMIVEFGCSDGNPRVKAEDWAHSALTDILSNRWPSVRGFSWWNEQWENDDTPAHNTNMRVQDNPAMAQVFRELFQRHAAAIESTCRLPPDAAPAAAAVGQTPL